jgi:hypothetical protein
MSDLWPWIRDKFPPARAVAILTPVVLPIIAWLNAYIADHLPYVADQVGPDQVNAIIVGTLAAGVALAYKWLDGRKEWESKQIEARLAVAQNNADPNKNAIDPSAVVEPAEPAANTTIVNNDNSG